MSLLGRIAKRVIHPFHRPEPPPPPPPKRTDPPKEAQSKPRVDGFTPASGASGVTQKQIAEATKTQQDLSRARQELGAEQQRQQPPLDPARRWAKKLVDRFTGRDKENEKRLKQLEKKVKDLERVEASQPVEAVERARFTVFQQRFAELEKEMGTKGAITIARQTYYDSGVWNGARGSIPASEAAINRAGLPHHPTYVKGIANEGYGGEMRTPDGRQVDMGHVVAGLDFKINGNVPGSPLDINSATLSGDVASAINNGAVRGPDARSRAWDAIKAEGDADWRGDIDATNLAHRYENDPKQRVSDLFATYYGNGAYQHRVTELAGHSKYIKRENGQPVRDASGGFVVDREALQRDASRFATLLRHDGSGEVNPSREVVNAWQQWLQREQAMEARLPRA